MRYLIFRQRQIRQLSYKSANCRTQCITKKFGDYACSLASKFFLSHLSHFRKANHGLITHFSYSHESCATFPKYAFLLRRVSKSFLPFPSPKIRSTIMAKRPGLNVRMDQRSGQRDQKGLKKYKMLSQSPPKIDHPLDQQHSSSPDVYFVFTSTVLCHHLNPAILFLL